METAVVQFSLYTEDGKRSLEQCLAASDMVDAICSFRRLMDEIGHEKITAHKALGLLLVELETRGVDVNRLMDEV